MDDRPYRSARDSLGEVRIPAGVLWGPQTQRAVDNFGLSGLRMPAPFIHALGLVKWAAAEANAELGELDAAMAAAIGAAALEVAAGTHDAQFPVDVFQTGSGTSSNMNANEVIAELASRRLGATVHPNDHVNRGQSSNDTVPTAIHVALSLELQQRVLPALAGLAAAIGSAAVRAGAQLKTGRTHLMDAMPMRVSRELGAWRSQLLDCIARLHESDRRLRRLAQGATAIGSGVNAPAGFGARVAAGLSRRTGLQFETAPDPYAALAAQDTALEFSGQLRVTAVCLMKIANDLRWMNSGPLAGLGEVTLPALQPGSSIMPGKVNPVIPEAVAMACAAVIGHDAAVAVAGQSGNFQLNTMLPLIAHALLQSEGLIAAAASALSGKAIDGMQFNAARLDAALAMNPVLATALNPLIGYDRAAAIARRAFAEGRTVLEVAAETTGIDRRELARLLDPARLAGSEPADGPVT
jgi:fumarate hydratase class II